MLGELYKPHGLARETAQQVLEVEEPYAVNVAWGCSNGCLYCYGPKVGKQNRESWIEMRPPLHPPAELVGRQLFFKNLKPNGVFTSFMTDPFLNKNKFYTEELLVLLAQEYSIEVATCSKMGVSSLNNCVRHGMTIVSLDDDFWRKWEPNTLHPTWRIKKLEEKHFKWISMEPYPPSTIWKQDLKQLLEEIKFVNLILFGKWNYDPRANTAKAKEDYRENIQVLRDFCKSNNIRYHIKSDTLKFCEIEAE